MTTPPTEKTPAALSPAARDVLTVLREAPGVPLFVRAMPGFQQLTKSLQAWVIDVERRLERQECQR